MLPFKTDVSISVIRSRNISVYEFSRELVLGMLEPRLVDCSVATPPQCPHCLDCFLHDEKLFGGYATTSWHLAISPSTVTEGIGTKYM